MADYKAAKREADMKEQKAKTSFKEMEIDEIYCEIDKFISQENVRTNRMYCINTTMWYLIERDSFTKIFSWAIPDKKTIDDIKTFVDGDSVLEIGAGNGLWYYLLKKLGVNIHATDIYNDNVEVLTNIEALEKYETNVLFMCWPPYSDSMAYESLKKFNGNKLIYIGEGEGGFTGDYYFHEELEEWKFEKMISIKMWYGINDSVFLYVRK